MSDQYGSYGQNNPYGDPPFGGQQPPQYGQPFGQGGPPPAYGRDPDKRPGTVFAAALITIILSSLTALLGVFAVIETTANRDWIRQQILDNPRYDFDKSDVDQALDVLVGMSVALIVLSVLAILVAAFVLRRSNVARVLLVVLSAITIVGSLVAIASLVSVLTLVAAIVVIVLLFTGGANDWFRRTRIVPYGQQPWG